MLNRLGSLRDKLEAQEAERIALVEKAHKEALKGEVEIKKTKKVKK